MYKLGFLFCSILLDTLEQIAETLKKEFGDPFEPITWNNFFLCAVAFLIQDSLQLELFSGVKKGRVLSQYGDMRLRAAELIRQMWFSLGERKRVEFVPYMVGTFLDMALVPEPTLRRIAIPIFFDMIRCDFAKNGTFQKVCLCILNLHRKSVCLKFPFWFLRWRMN